MKNEELFLSNYDVISNLLNAGINLKQHKEYNNLALIDSMKDAMDTNLGKYCVDFHGLLITYKSAAHLIKPEYIITKDNLTTITWAEPMLYAKRILKLYHISDAKLLEEHKLVYPKQPDINLAEMVDKINASFNDEVELMLDGLRTRYVQFLAKNIIRVYQAN
jgi:hypothetical protein